MSKPETLLDLLTGEHVTIGDIKKIAAALWQQHTLASFAFPAPYNLQLPDFDKLPGHVQGFIVKGLLDSKVSPTLAEKNPD
jgi:hypothetical protein